MTVFTSSRNRKLITAVMYHLKLSRKLCFIQVTLLQVLFDDPGQNTVSRKHHILLVANREFEVYLLGHHSTLNAVLRDCNAGQCHVRTIL